MLHYLLISWFSLKWTPYLGVHCICTVTGIVQDRNKLLQYIGTVFSLICSFLNVVNLKRITETLHLLRILWRGPMPSFGVRARKKAFDGKRHKNYVIRIVEVMVKEFCETVCYMEPDCVSINLEKGVDGNRKYKCEWNNVTHEGHEGDLIEEENYFYHAVEVTAI